VEYLTVKWIHILSSTLLFGTGLGSAFYMYFASRTRDPHVIAVVARYVVVADWLFTTPTVLIQPLSGFYLLHLMGLPWRTPWVIRSLALFVVAALAWLPVVWMQMRMRDLAADAVRKRQSLPRAYHQLFRLWFAFGFPAFAAVLAIFWLMIAKSSIGF